MKKRNAERTLDGFTRIHVGPEKLAAHEELVSRLRGGARATLDMGALTCSGAPGGCDIAIKDF